MQRRSGVIAVLAAVVLAGDVAAAATLRARHHAAIGPPAVTGPATTTTTTTPSSALTVAGTVTAVHITGAVGPPIPVPLVITIPTRGQGELNIEHVVFGGRAGATVAWDGGQPLPLAGSGALVLGPATMDANAGGLTWHLDGMPRFLAPGHYVAGSAVAVGVAGLAQPLDRAAFDVAAGTPAVVVTVGDAQVHEARLAVHVTGPGAVQLLGAITLGARTVHDLNTGPGPFDLTFMPVAGGFTVQGIVGGPVSLLR